MHKNYTPRPTFPAPVAERIASLSEEFLTADAVRRNSIGEEVQLLIDTAYL